MMRQAILNYKGFVFVYDDKKEYISNFNFKFKFNLYIRLFFDLYF